MSATFPGLFDTLKVILLSLPSFYDAFCLRLCFDLQPPLSVGSLALIFVCLMHKTLSNHSWFISKRTHVFILAVENDFSPAALVARLNCISLTTATTYIFIRK